MIRDIKSTIRWLDQNSILVRMQLEDKYCLTHQLESRRDSIKFLLEKNMVFVRQFDGFYKNESAFYMEFQRKGFVSNAAEN